MKLDFSMFHKAKTDVDTSGAFGNSYETSSGLGALTKQQKRAGVAGSLALAGGVINTMQAVGQGKTQMALARMQADSLKAQMDVTNTVGHIQLRDQLGLDLMQRLGGDLMPSSTQAEVFAQQGRNAEFNLRNQLYQIQTKVVDAENQYEIAKSNTKNALMKGVTSAVLTAAGAAFGMPQVGEAAASGINAMY
jgi:predicted sulfurtransferase